MEMSRGMAYLQGSSREHGHGGTSVFNCPNICDANVIVEILIYRMNAETHLPPTLHIGALAEMPASSLPITRVAEFLANALGNVKMKYKNMLVM